MYPTLFTIGNLNIPTYTILLDLGLILGLVLTYFEGRRCLKAGETALDLGLWTVIGGILGGRIGYVLANWGVFSEDWGRAFRIWEGGLAFHGAFLGGLAVMVAFSLLQRRRKDPLSFWVLGDVVTPGLALGLIFGWAACLMGGCAYGVLGKGFGYAILPDIYGVEASRFATQAVGLGFAILLFVIFWILRKRWPYPGAAFLMFNLLYFAGQFLLESTRGDEAIYLGPWRLAQTLDLVIALAAAAGLTYYWWQSRQVEEPKRDEIPDATLADVEEPRDDEPEAVMEEVKADTAAPEEVEELEDEEHTVVEGAAASEEAIESSDAPPDEDKGLEDEDAEIVEEATEQEEEAVEPKEAQEED
jgi:phosphatidylglycerol:prolipoprotein diacylglycerol transferase